jgi:hypothetical protein
VVLYEALFPRTKSIIPRCRVHPACVSQGMHLHTFGLALPPLSSFRYHLKHSATILERCDQGSLTLGSLVVGSTVISTVASASHLHM